MATKLSGYEWQHRIDIRESWNRVQQGEISATQLGKEIANHLQTLLLVYPQDEELAQLAEDFAEAPADPDEFDILLDYLYDWGDRDKRLWIDQII